MKPMALTLALLLATAGTLPMAARAQGPVRVTESFNQGWKFKAGEVASGESAMLDDGAWRRLSLPHDFQMEQPWVKSASSQRGFKEMGIGWYRKSFKADAGWKGRKVLLDFDGMMLFGEVWLNGHKILDVDYGYLGKEVDLSPHLNFGGNNVVAVRTSTGANRQSRWYTGGGLFRDVSLIVKDQVSIARNGVFVTTPNVSRQSADVAVQVDVEGISGKALNVEVRTEIFGPDGKRVSQSSVAAPQNMKMSCIEIPLPSMHLEAPRLWSPDSPNLYRANVALVLDGRKVDEINETFGIRSIEFSKQSGLKLNGEKLLLKGAADHEDYGALGTAVYDRSIERLFKRLKAFGFNHVRTSHNPYSSAFMRLADKYGILVVDELADKWSDGEYWPGAKPFTQIWYDITQEWIRRDRNHASVVMWSLGNELQMREDLTGFPGTKDWGVTSYKILKTLVERHDPTRATTVAMYPSRANAITRHDPDFNTKVIPPELSLVTDVSSFNYQYKAYQQYLSQAPELIIYQSEASTATLTASWFGMDLQKMVGLAYWGAVEYWSESSGWPKKGWNFSYFNHALEPNPQAYLIKSAFSDEPLIRIAVVDSAGEAINWNDIDVGRAEVSSHWNRVPGRKYAMFTYTNADEVELQLDGQSLGVRQNQRNDPERRNIIQWEDVPYEKGGRLIAIARTGGKEVARHVLETTGPAKRLQIEAENPSDWKAGEGDLQYIKIRALDAKGRPVPTADNEVTVDVAGAGELVAIDDGDHTSDALFGGKSKRMHDGFVMAIVRSKKTAGSVSVKVSAPGIAGQRIRLSTN
ncbi:beta-galactosidase [Sphingobium sp. AP50]|uniref:glycoside hydrolase family 2 TIM barrel-domain containing protein n=1 Tax=Sphingobium sp. AP50 TaxID=1884369 RepID=UPI0008BE31F3|nr:glycoside hydrolase family 2 TIM barrel-domain containing protein [Sphingobium sp. AP50]SEJ73478.1 beta-galactosidase [Sphingobium sp. AP50]